jgi:tetratricopeptide (TPR) repeat protein
MGSPSIESSRALYFYTGLGLVLAFGFLVVPFHAAFGHLYGALGLPALITYGLDDVSVKAVIVVAIVALVSYGERRPLSSIGIRRPHLTDVALGIGAFILSEALTYVLETLVPHGFVSDAAGRLALFARLPLWLMLLDALVNGIFEEMTARGFAVERLSEITHSTVAGALIALALNLMTHLPYWGWRQTIILAPALSTFLALYLWRRSIVPCAIGHILNDAFPSLMALVPAFLPMYLVPYLSFDRQGAIYYAKGDFDRSIQLFTRAIARNPRDSYAYDWRGIAWFDKKDYPKALADFAQAMHIDPTSAAAYGDRAFVYETRHDNQRAIADLDQAIRLEPDVSSWYEMRARIEFATQDWKHAAQDYGRAIRLDPSDDDLYSDRAYAEYLNGDYDLAIRDYRALVRFRPKDSDAWTNLAMGFEENKNYEKALDALKHALEIDPSYSSIYQERMRVHESQKRYDLAFDDVTKAIALEPANPDLYDSRAYLRLIRDNDMSGAIADYDKAVKLDPKHSETYVERAWVYAAQKNNGAAIADYDRAIDLKQDDSSLYVQRGEMFYRSHDYSKAMADWQKALNLKKDDDATYNSMAWLLATSSDPKARDGKKAIEFATRSCELSKWKMGEEIDTLAAAYAETGDFKHAVELESQALALMKPDGETMKQGRARLDLYEHRHPYREPSDAPAEHPNPERK